MLSVTEDGGERRTWFWSRWDSWLLTTTITAVAFAVLVTLVKAGWSPLLAFDSWTERSLYGLIRPHEFLTTLLVVVERITDPWVLRAIGVIAAAVLYRRGERRLAVWLGTSTLLSWPVEVVTKLLFARPRPEPMLSPHASTSLPSGHALTSMIVIGALLVLGLRQPGAPVRRRLAWMIAAGPILAIGADRLLLSVHYPSDVVAGWLLGIAVLGGSALAFGLALPIRADRPGIRRRRLGVVLNPTKVADVRDFRRQVDRLAAEFGWARPLWFETTPDDAGRAMTRAALAEGVDLVLVAGGDGTVRVVCGELAGTGVPVGIVPAGTGNLLVRNLALPLDPESAIRGALTGRDRPIDLVRVRGDDLAPDRFAVMAGLGLDAAVMNDAPDRLKAQMGWAAYLVSIARNLSFPAVRVDIAVDGGRPVRRWARTVLVGNVGTLHGGVSLLPLAAPDDGLLDIVVLAPRRVTDWPVLAWRVMLRSPARDERLSHWRGRRAVIRAVDVVPRQLDGDVVAVGHELRCEVEPGVLIVRVPSGL